MLENTLLYECTASTTLAFNSWLLQARILNSCTSVLPVFHGLTLYSNGLVLATHSCTAGSSGVYSSGLVPAGIIIMYKLYMVKQWVVLVRISLIYERISGTTYVYAYSRKDTLLYTVQYRMCLKEIN